MPKVSWTQDKLDFMARIIPGHSEREIRAMFFEKYGIELTEGQIGNTKAKLGIKSGTRGGQFKKGQEPFNKGKKWQEFRSAESQAKCLQTAFRKGNEPTNGKRRKLGDERTDKDGYTMVKVRRFRDKHYSTSCWKPKHRVIWEEANNKKLPSNTVVVFADGNRQNFDPDNLVAIPGLSGQLFAEKI